MVGPPRLGVHILNAPQPPDIARLHALLKNRCEITCGPRLPDPAEFEVLVAGRPERAHLEASENLRWLIVPFAGLPDATRELLGEFPKLEVHNLHHNAGATAEMALGLLLAAAKRIVPADQGLRRGDWSIRYSHETSLRLDGRTAVVLGFGAIGQRVAHGCRALGMRVVGIRRRAITHDIHADADELHPVEALPTLLPRAEVLLVCLPGACAGLLGAEELALLPPDALLVNVGRGPVVEEAALYAALAEGRLFGAGLDVWYRYPGGKEAASDTPPSEHPFGELENVVLSPHRAGHGADIERLRMEGLADLLLAAADGGPLPNRVDPVFGY